MYMRIFKFSRYSYRLKHFGLFSVKIFIGASTSLYNRFENYSKHFVEKLNFSRTTPETRTSVQTANPQTRLHLRATNASVDALAYTMHLVRVYTTYYTHTRACDTKPKTRTSDHPLTRAHTYIKQGCRAHGAVESRADSVATAVVSARPADDEPGRILMKTSFYGKYEIDHYVMPDMCACAQVCVRARERICTLCMRARSSRD